MSGRADVRILALLLALAVAGPAALAGQESSPDTAHAPPPADVAASPDSARSVVFVDTDAWGAQRSVGLAIGEVALINAVVWGFNEFLRGANFTQVNPRTWWTNISDGFFFDDNQFTTNLFAHPYHGSLYYTAARSNGLNYWQSAPFALAGSFFWECCSEAHPMAWNDWMATGFGGMAIGEALYRASSTVLDNEAVGGERVRREIFGFLISPVRGFNRVVTGRSGRVSPNPENPQDRTPNHLTNVLRVGYRHIASEITLGEEESTDDYGAGFVEFDMRFGNPFEDSRHEPFDQFQFGLTLNFHDKKVLGGFRITGNLLTSELRRSDKVHHLFVVTQNFDYTNDNAIEFGGQSFGAGIQSKWGLSDTWSLRTDVNGHGYVLNAVNSEYAFGATIPDRERLREYDLGAGAGAWLRAGLVKDATGHEFVGVGYRLAWVHTLNGSNVNGGDTEHLVQMMNVQGAMPIAGPWGVGADATAYLRNSYFDEIGFEDVEQRVGRLRVYGWLRTF